MVGMIARKIIAVIFNCGDYTKKPPQAGHHSHRMRSDSVYGKNE